MSGRRLNEAERGVNTMGLVPKADKRQANRVPLPLRRIFASKTDVKQSGQGAIYADPKFRIPYMYKYPNPRKQMGDMLIRMKGEQISRRKRWECDYPADDIDDSFAKVFGKAYHQKHQTVFDLTLLAPPLELDEIDEIDETELELFDLRGPLEFVMPEYAAVLEDKLQKDTLNESTIS